MTTQSPKTKKSATKSSQVLRPPQSQAATQAACRGAASPKSATSSAKKTAGTKRVSQAAPKSSPPKSPPTQENASGLPLASLSTLAASTTSLAAPTVKGAKTGASFAGSSVASPDAASEGAQVPEHVRRQAGKKALAAYTAKLNGG